MGGKPVGTRVRGDDAEMCWMLNAQRRGLPWPTPVAGAEGSLIADKSTVAGDATEVLQQHLYNLGDGEENNARTDETTQSVNAACQSEKGEKGDIDMMGIDSEGDKQNMMADRPQRDAGKQSPSSGQSSPRGSSNDDAGCLTPIAVISHFDQHLCPTKPNATIKDTVLGEGSSDLDGKTLLASLDLAMTHARNAAHDADLALVEANRVLFTFANTACEIQQY